MFRYHHHHHHSPFHAIVIVSLLFSSFVVFGIVLANATATTPTASKKVQYQLEYIGTVFRESSSFHQQRILPEFATELTTNISNGILDSCYAVFYSTTNVDDNHTTTTNGNPILEPENLRCIHEEDDGITCDAAYFDKPNALSLRLSVRIEETTIHDNDRLTFQIDANLRTSDRFLARECLVRSILNIPHPDSKNKIHPTWTIRYRPSIHDMQTTFEKRSSVSGAHLYDESHMASVDELVLGNPLLQHRTRIDADQTSSSSFLEVWQYETANHVNPVRLLFVNEQLQTTTLAAGTVHAEALVHPIMVASTHPERVLVISIEPSAIVREILKHKSVQSAKLLGANMQAMELVQHHMPSLLDCSFLGTLQTNCLKQDQVELIEEDVMAWLEEAEESQDEDFDVIFVDVPMGTDEWLSLEVISYLSGLFNTTFHHGVIVLSAGITPSLFDKDALYNPTTRDILVFNSTDIFELVTIYDESLAKPLPCTFIAIMCEDKETYKRFFRKQPDRIDMDLIQKLYSGIEPRGRPTMVYDGPTHVRYLEVPRVWENWYCNAPPGKDVPICTTVLPDWFDNSYHHFSTEVRDDPVKGRSLYASEDIPKGHFVLPSDAGLSLHLDAYQWEALNKFIDDFPHAVMYQQLRDFILAYGYESDSFGQSGWDVSIASNNTFTNHACTSLEASVGHVSIAFVDESGMEPGFSPPLMRRAHLFSVLTTANRDMKAGDEILMDYSLFRSNVDPDFVSLLESMCHKGIGLVPIVTDVNISKDSIRDEF